MPVVPATWEAEVGESSEPEEVKAAVCRDCATALNPEWQSERLSQEKTKEKKDNNKIVVLSNITQLSFLQLHPTALILFPEEGTKSLGVWRENQSWGPKNH